AQAPSGSRLAGLPSISGPASLLVSLDRRRLLDVRTGDGQVGDYTDDQHAERYGDDAAAHAEPAGVLRLAQAIGDRGAEGPSDDVCQPKAQDGVPASPTMAHRGDD